MDESGSSVSTSTSSLASDTSGAGAENERKAGYVASPLAQEISSHKVVGGVEETDDRSVSLPKAVVGVEETSNRSASSLKGVEKTSNRSASSLKGVEKTDNRSVSPPKAAISSQNMAPTEIETSNQPSLKKESIDQSATPPKTTDTSTSTSIKEPAESTPNRENQIVAQKDAKSTKCLCSLQ
jgi:hypothetical protein